MYLALSTETLEVVSQLVFTGGDFNNFALCDTSSSEIVLVNDYTKHIITFYSYSSNPEVVKLSSNWNEPESLIANEDAVFIYV